MKQADFCLFSTKLGTLGLAWTEDGLIAVQLPEKTATQTCTQLLKKLPTYSATETEKFPAFIRELIKKLDKHLSGNAQDFSQTKISWNTTSTFAKDVYQFCLKSLNSGEIATYGEVAKAVGKPKSARAVGMVMGKNPMPIVMPCHRVISSSKRNRLCGFSAFGGVDTKEKLLALEGISLS